MCKHSEEVSNMSCPSTPLELNEKMLESMHFPPDIRHQLKELGSPSTILQRVSRHSLVMRAGKRSFLHPLQLLHIRIDVQGKIHCQCSDYRSTSTLSAMNTSVRLSKRCIHVYGGLWALLSSPEMQLDFPLQFQQELSGMYVK